MVVEVYGAWSPEAHAVLRKLAQFAALTSDRSDPVTARSIYQRLSVSLMHSTANAILGRRNPDADDGNVSVATTTDGPDDDDDDDADDIRSEGPVNEAGPDDDDDADSEEEARSVMNVENSFLSSSLVISNDTVFLDPLNVDSCLIPSFGLLSLVSEFGISEGGAAAGR